MNVLALVPNQLGFNPGQRSSIETWTKVLEPRGISVQFLPFETERLHKALYEGGSRIQIAKEMSLAFAARLGHVRTISDFDAVFIHREASLIGPAVVERWLARKKLPIIYELDDPLFVPYKSPFTGYLSYLKFFGKVDTITRISRCVIVNSPFLRDYALKHNQNVWEIPSVVDADQYEFRPREPADPVCVGWSGSPSTAPNLQVVADALRMLDTSSTHQVHLIGSKTFDLPGVRFTSQPWVEATEVQDLRRIDIGLVPLPDNPWNRLKFFLKIPQYMALGIPPVATPMGTTPLDIQHGVNGFLAASTAEWIEHIQRLIKDDELRKEMSANAARTAVERFTVQCNADQIEAAFRSAVN